MTKLRKILAAALSFLMIVTVSSFSRTKIEAQETAAFHSLYNVWTGRHVFTADEKEMDLLVKQGWKDEGTAWNALTSGDTPVYRLYNVYSGDHYFTDDSVEAEQLVKRGWQNEGTVFYSDRDHSVPVYKLCNPYDNGVHFFTTSFSQYESLKKAGWNGENTAFYASSASAVRKDEPVSDNNVKDTAVEKFEKDHAVGASGEAYHSYVMPMSRDGLDIYGELFLPDESKESYPLIIIGHGFNSSYTYTSQFAADFAKKGFAAYVFDFIGGAQNSRSGGSMEDMSVRTEQADMESVLSSLKQLSFIDSNKIFLMGESQGGMVAALTAAKLNREIKGLILYYPAFVLPDDARTWYTDEEHIPDHPVSFGNVEVGRKYFEDVINMDVYQEISGYTGPVCIIHGDKDGTVPLSYSEKAAEVYQNASLHVIPGCGHGFFYDMVTRADTISIDFIHTVLLSGVSI